MVCRYLTFDDRQKIAEMWEAQQPAAIIACAIPCAPATIHREIKLGNANGELDRNQRLKYDPELAQRLFHESLRRRGRKKG